VVRKDVESPNAIISCRRRWFWQRQKKPVCNRISRWCSAPIVRGAGKSAGGARLLKQGCNVCIFPKERARRGRTRSLRWRRDPSARTRPRSYLDLSVGARDGRKAPYSESGPAGADVFAPVRSRRHIGDDGTLRDILARRHSEERAAIAANEAGVPSNTPPSGRPGRNADARGLMAAGWSGQSRDEPYRR
jgi:hypothetical protein